MANDRSIKDIRDSIDSLVTEAEAAHSFAGKNAQSRATPQAGASPAGASPAGTPQAGAPQAVAPVVPPVPQPQPRPAGSADTLTPLARPLIEQWIATELPRLAERILTERLAKLDDEER